jgi:hypothetical protein
MSRSAPARVDFGPADGLSADMAFADGEHWSQTRDRSRAMALMNLSVLCVVRGVLAQRG